MPRHITPRTTLATIRREAKRWLRALRASDAAARERLIRAHPHAPATPTLRDVQHALALEYGFSGWIALKERVEAAAAPNRTEPLKPEDLRLDKPYGRWASRGVDVWDAMRAAAAGNAETLRTLLARDANLARYGEPLHLAVRAGHTDVVRFLLDAGADPDMRGSDGETLATMARERGQEGIARLLEAAPRRSVRVAPADDAEHPIHVAAARGRLRTVRKLLDADPALVHRADRKGGTPLHRAAACSARRVIELLIDRGADIHAVHGDGPGDEHGYAPADHQPIDLALFRHGRPDVKTARLLLARGATYDVTIAAALGDIDELRRMLDENPARIREARAWGKRPLSAAVERGHEAIVRLLLERGADPNWPEGPYAPRGFALHAAARMGDRPVVELLLDHGADPNGTVDSSGSATWAAKTRELRALMIARGGMIDCYDLVWLHEDEEVVRRVAANPAEADVGCGTVFTAAATMGKRDLVVRLLAAGARVPPVVTGCRSYLMENPEILRLLLAGGMDPDLPNARRATPLHDLCGRDARGRPHPKRRESAVILLEAGANISARDDEYRSTPLAWAARTDLPDMVELLLARGAPAKLPDDEPWATPLAWATKRGHARVIELLRRAGATV